MLHLDDVIWNTDEEEDFKNANVRLNLSLKRRAFDESHVVRDNEGQFADKPGGGGAKKPVSEGDRVRTPDGSPGRFLMVFPDGNAGVLLDTGKVESHPVDKLTHEPEPKRSAEPEAAEAPLGNQPPSRVVKQKEQLSTGERMSRDGYLLSDGNEFYNQGLRRGKLKPDDLGVVDLDNAISKFATKSDTVTYRGMAKPEGLDLSIGSQFEDLAYVSTTGDSNVAHQFAEFRVSGKSENINGNAKPLGGEPVVMAINIPKGTNLMPGDSSVDEFILPRGLSFRVTAQRPDGVLEVELV